MIEDVGFLIREIALEHVMPHFQVLAQDDIREKTPGEWVTSVDTKVERLLAKSLPSYAEGLIIGEEQVSHSGEGSLYSLTEESVWLIDPLDGTANFIRGEGPFALMVAYVRKGSVAASWIYLPKTDCLVMAEYGSGLWKNGQRIVLAKTDKPLPFDQITAAAHMGHFPLAEKEYIEERLSHLKENQPCYCAGYDYIAIAEGRKHFSLYNRTLPWDHVPGTFMVLEAGGYVARLDNQRYNPWQKREGLMAAQSEELWQEMQHFVVPPVRTAV
ncbi:MAG: hypothetical protein CMF31_10245 [Kordiimonas sp.]|nr:hypothetical protein [Kordiimonas sp.]|tara:strand:+ start:4995 stop:5807 length:813 start_codon:yes stop_codon:yes gene_type:complete